MRDVVAVADVGDRDALELAEVLAQLFEKLLPDQRLRLAAARRSGLPSTTSMVVATASGT